MMRFGIPEYRLPRTLIRAEIDKILALGVTLKLRRPLTPHFGLAELKRRRLRVRLPVGRRFEGARPAGPGRRAGRRRQGRRLPAERQPRLPHGPRPPGRGHRRRLRRLRRGAHGAAPRSRRATSTASAAGEADARAEGGARLGPRRRCAAAPREVTIVSLENFDEMPVLRTTQGHEEFEEAQQEGVRSCRAAARSAFSASRPARIRRAASACARSSTQHGRFAPQYDETDVGHDRGRRAASWRSASSRTSPS